MASIAGAKQAIRDRLDANWTTTPVCHQNPNNFEPPTDPNSGGPLPWVFLEVFVTESRLRGAGIPGDHIWLTTGLIHAHVFVPVNSGPALAEDYAVAIGEIFRAATFYNDGQGAKVVSGIDPAPYPDGGGSSDDKGNWYRVTMTCDYEFFHRG